MPQAAVRAQDRIVLAADRRQPVGGMAGVDVGRPSSPQALPRAEIPKLENSIRATADYATVLLQHRQASHPTIVASERGLTTFSSKGPDLHRAVVSPTEQQLLVRLITQAPHG